MLARCTLLLGMAIFGLTGDVTAAEPTQELPLELRALQKVSEGKPLLGLAMLEADKSNDASVLQSVATVRSVVGDWRGALQAMDQFYPRPTKDAEPFADGLTRVTALDAIVEEARQHRIVIVNEAHHVPRHRAFIQQMLQQLLTEGVEYYAFETLAEFPVMLTFRGYPVGITGAYAVEPVFGELIRESLRLQYKLVAYESMGMNASKDPIDNINAREADQCRNLERIFKANPTARVIIHVGFDHAMERPRKTPDGREILWMAARLAKATDLDPLTIDQVVHTERSEESRASPEWRQALKNGWLDRPIVLRRADGRFEVSGHFAGLVDMQVFHPPTKLVDGRPDWINAGGDRVAVAIPDEIQAEPRRVLVQAFADRESDAAVPCDQLALTADEPRPKLLLRPGKYRVVVQDEAGKELSRQTLVVKREAD